MAGGIFNVVIRLSSTAVMGITTAVFSSVELTPAGIADPLLKYTRTFQTCVGLSAACILVSLFIRLGTQGNASKEPTDSVNLNLAANGSKKELQEKIDRV
jgi:hypothetical protein